MESVFCKARKISKSLKGNRGSVARYNQYLDRTLSDVDFSDKGKLLASGIDGAEQSPLAFWKSAEERELQTKRKDTARFAKEYIVGLPHNLPIEEMEKVSRAISAELSKNGRVVSWYLHEPDKDENEISKNFHTHFLLSEREYQNGKFAETKNRDWNSKQTLREHKKIIGEKINERLRALNLPEWKIELTEEEKQEQAERKGEERKAQERRIKKELKKADRKLKLAEVKLNGFGRAERQLSNEPGTVEARPGQEQQSNSAGASSLEKQFQDFNELSNRFADFQRASDASERAEQARKAELDRQRREAEKRSQYANIIADIERKSKPKRVEKDNGWTR